MINGKRYGWEDVTINFPHGVLLDVESIEYGDKKEDEAIYGKGAAPRGYGSGNYSAEAKVSLKREEFNRLVEHARAQGKSLYRLAPFPITVSFANDDEAITTDILPACKITETSQSTSQGDKSVKVDLTLVVLNPIIYNGQPAV